VDRGGTRGRCQRQGQEEAAEEPRSPAHGRRIDSAEQGLDRRSFSWLLLNAAAKYYSCCVSRCSRAVCLCRIGYIAGVDLKFKIPKVSHRMIATLIERIKYRRNKKINCTVCL
jgi:hypothetical protein